MFTRVVENPGLELAEAEQAEDENPQVIAGSWFLKQSGFPAIFAALNSARNSKATSSKINSGLSS
jgi:hypothetical protein